MVRRAETEEWGSDGETAEHVNEVKEAWRDGQWRDLLLIDGPGSREWDVGRRDRRCLRYGLLIRCAGRQLGSERRAT